MTDEQLVILMAWLGAVAEGKDLHQEGVAAELHDRALRFVAGARKRGGEVTLNGLEVTEVTAEVKP